MSEENKNIEQEKESTEVPVNKKEKKSRKTTSSRKKDKADQKVQEMGEKLEELNDKYLRLFSEFDNYRKRTQKEKLELFKTASEDVMTALLPVLDDFERALTAVPDDIAGNSWLEGIQLVQRKLLNILEGLNVKPIESVGQPFDPIYHEAIMQELTDEYESGTVSTELQKGYKIWERVIRPSLVYVAE